MTGDRNVLGGPLEPCGTDPMTGFFRDGSCTTGLQQNNFVILNAQAIFGQISSGKYCVIIFDPGTLTGTQNYTITISFP